MDFQQRVRRDRLLRSAVFGGDRRAWQTWIGETFDERRPGDVAILKAPLKLEYLPDGSLHKVEYTGPTSSRLEFFLPTNPFILPAVDGKPIDLAWEVDPNVWTAKGVD